ncbi:flavodoxin family protein [Paradesulfitobacterium ferrireducens]|uniref:flavodoxin family protein n=1 Tax=Paradesulfitobacterium ferrireducens TaxID=2816476 RepID=UPI001A8C1002|nr:NAD(P)H-dependent oxidoreductase [Paradesulfitobacterium ferrireducens]
MPLILGISGSPRKGATEYAVKTALEAAKTVEGIETEYWSVHQKKIGFCIHCDRCIREKSFCYQDDGVRELENLIVKADGIIVGSPVYDMNITAQLAACFNRLRPMFIVQPSGLRHKIGGAIAVGGTRHGGQEFTLAAINNFFIMNEMHVVGGPGGCYNGGKIWSKDAKVQGAQEDTVGMNTVRALGLAVAEATIITSIGRAAFQEKYTSRLEPVRDH